MEDLKWFVGFLIFFIVAWFLGGGIMQNLTSPFIAPPVPVGGGTAGATHAGGAGTKTGDLSTDLKKTAEQNGISPLKGLLTLTTGSYGATTVGDEYVVLTVSETAPARVLLTGMTIKSDASGRSATIGQGAYLMQQGTINANEPIYLEPGGVAYVVTGRPPAGYSFRLNTCTGYFTQFQRFTPSLPTECPRPNKEPLPPPPNNLSDPCLEFIDTMRRCRIEPAPPDTLSPECRNFIRDNFTYPKCVANHKPDADFYKNEWRIYLSRDNTLWKSTREIIKLLDTDGKAVDTITY